MRIWLKIYRYPQFQRIKMVRCWWLGFWLTGLVYFPVFKIWGFHTFPVFNMAGGTREHTYESTFLFGLFWRPGSTARTEAIEKRLRKKWSSKNTSHHVIWCLLVGKPKNQPRHSKIWGFLETLDPQNPWGFKTDSWSNIVIHDDWMIWWCTSRLGNLHMVY